MTFEIRVAPGPGGRRAYPVDHEAESLCAIMGQKTLTLKQLRELEHFITNIETTEENPQ